MSKLILKHQQKNGKGTGKLVFSPEALQYIQSELNYVPGMNISSNSTISLSNQHKKQKENVDKTVKDLTKKIAERHSHKAILERDQKRRTPNVNVTDGYAEGTIQDADKIALDKVLSWYGLSNGLGLMTNVSDLMRNTPQFGRQMGLLYGDMAKIGLTTGLGAAIAPTLVPGGSFWTKGIQWLNPSKYLGKGYYSTIMGGQNASLLGAAADAGLTSYGAAEALLHFYNNPNLGSGVMAAMAAGPVAVVGKYNPVGKPIELTVLKIKSGLFTKADLGDYLEGKQIDELLKSIHKFGNAVSEPKILRTLLNKIKMGTKGKKGTNTEINAVKLEEFAKTPEGILDAIRNRKIIKGKNEDTGEIEYETIWDRLTRDANNTGIDWRDDALVNLGSYMVGMDTDLKLKPVGFDNETPFILRYYDNVVNHILNSGFLDKILKSGDLRKTADGKHWEGKWPDGTWNIVRRPEEYIKMRYAQDVKHANVELPKPIIHEGEIFDMMPMHGAGLGENNKPVSKELNNWLEYLRKPSTAPGKNGYWTIIRDLLAKQSHATGHYQLKNYSVPFYRMPKYEYDKPFKPGNSYGLMDLMKGSYSGKIMQPKGVQDGVPGIINEYNFGPTFDHNPKSLWNTLDFEPGAGPMAYIELKNNNKNNYA